MPLTAPVTLVYVDRIVAHEMVHAAMLASGTLKWSSMPKFFFEGVADLINGDDDYNAGYNNEIDQSIKKFFENPDTLTDALSDNPSMAGIAYYPAGSIYLRSLAKMASGTTIFVGTDENKNRSINFDGNITIVTNYDESNTINYNTDFIRANIAGNYNDFAALKSDDEILMIRAGNGGSMLWGGYCGNNELYGGAGADTFIYDINGGNDKVYNAESQDNVLLRGMDLSQITSAQINDNGVSLSFSYGGTLNVEGTPANFILETSGTTYGADYQNKTWSQK